MRQTWTVNEYENYGLKACIIDDIGDMIADHMTPANAELIARLSPEVVLRVYEAIDRARGYAESSENTPTNLKISGALTSAIEALDGLTTNQGKG